MAVAPAPLASTSFAKPTPKRFVGAHRDGVRCVAWNVDGRRLASGSADRTIRIWQPEKDSRTSLEMKGHLGEVSRIKWSPVNPDHLVSCCASGSSKGDKGVYFWDIRQPKPTQIVQTEGENINIAWSPDGKVVVVGNRRDIVTWIDVETGSIIKTIKEAGEVNDSVFSPGGKAILTCLMNGVRISTFPEHKPLYTINMSPVAVQDVDYDPRGRYILAGGNDAVASLWETTEWTCVTSVGYHEEPVRCCRFSHDGALFAIGGGTEIHICEVPSGKKLHTITTVGGFDTLAWSPNRRLLAYTSEEMIGGRPSGAFNVFGL